MSKTKKRVTAATKLQALVRGKLARRTATAKKQQKQVKGRSAYKSYETDASVQDTDLRRTTSPIHRCAKSRSGKLGISSTQPF